MTIDAIKSRVPWRAKIFSKILLSRLPIPFSLWQRLRLFRHGDMDDADYALGVFRQHVIDSLGPDGISGMTLLELGPGDSFATGLMASAAGAERTYLVDHGRYARTDVRRYREMMRRWARQQDGMDFTHLQSTGSAEALIRDSRTVYMTEGLASIRRIPDASVDVIFSNAVLEHVRRHEFRGLVHALARILKPTGIMSHQVDLRDHLGGALNHLRFSEALWESRLITRSGFYTNRIRFGDMMRIFREAGLHARLKRQRQWQSLPTPKKRMAAVHRRLPDDDLLVSDFHVVLGKRRPGH